MAPMGKLYGIAEAGFVPVHVTLTNSLSGHQQYESVEHMQS